MPGEIIVRAIRVVQDGKTPLYSFYLRGRDILRVAEISRLKKSKDGDLLGYQRGAVARHVGEITDYLNAGDILFPHAILLAISGKVEFKESRGPQVGDPGCRPGVLQIPVNGKNRKPAWIVDGQQRTLALMQSKQNDMLVPITAFVSVDFEVHRTQFLLVNNVKPLPFGLINELLPEVNTALPTRMAKNKIPSALCNILNKDPESPFRGLIKRQTTDPKEKSEAVITDTSLIQVIRTSLNSPHGCLYQYKNMATGEVDSESVRKALNIYWTAVKETFPEAWGKPRSRLMLGVGIKAMGILMDRMMSSYDLRAGDDGEKIRKSLVAIKPFCAWTSGTWKELNGIPWSRLQNTSGDVRLLSNMLIRALTGQCCVS